MDSINTRSLINMSTSIPQSDSYKIPSDTSSYSRYHSLRGSTDSDNSDNSYLEIGSRSSIGSPYKKCSNLGRSNDSYDSYLEISPRSSIGSPYKKCSNLRRLNDPYDFYLENNDSPVSRSIHEYTKRRGSFSNSITVTVSNPMYTGQIHEANEKCAVTPYSVIKDSQQLLCWIKGMAYIHLSLYMMKEEINNNDTEGNLSKEKLIECGVKNVSIYVIVLHDDNKNAINAITIISTWFSKNSNKRNLYGLKVNKPNKLDLKSKLIRIEIISEFSLEKEMSDLLSTNSIKYVCKYIVPTIECGKIKKTQSMYTGETNNENKKYKVIPYYVIEDYEQVISWIYDMAFNPKVSLYLMVKNISENDTYGDMAKEKLKKCGVIDASECMIAFSKDSENIINSIVIIGTWFSKNSNEYNLYGFRVQKPDNKKKHIQKSKPELIRIKIWFKSNKDTEKEISNLLFSNEIDYLYKNTAKIIETGRILNHY